MRMLITIVRYDNNIANDVKMVTWQTAHGYKYSVVVTIKTKNTCG